MSAHRRPAAIRRAICRSKRETARLAQRKFLSPHAKGEPSCCPAGSTPTRVVSPAFPGGLFSSGVRAMRFSIGAAVVNNKATAPLGRVATLGGVLWA